MQAEALPERETKDITRLEESFRTFTQMTKDLEVAYNNLTRRAARIDLELRRSNSELEEKVAQLERLTRNKNEILDALPSGVVVLDATGTIAAVNEAAARLIGRPNVELIGRSKESITGPTGDELLITKVATTNMSVLDNRDVTCLDGSRRHLSLVRVDLPDGTEVQTITDLTIVTRLKEQMTRLDTLAALGEMAAGVAHEIRNPLNGIDGFAALLDRQLRKKPDAGTTTRYTENIRRGVREINSIVTNLLHFAATESFVVAPCNVTSLVEALVDDFGRFSANHQHVTLAFEKSERATDSRVHGDAVKLKIVFANLIRNAIEAVGAHGTVRITAELEEPSGRVVVQVDDNGRGLPTEIRERMYRPFSTTKPEGTGLGLALAHRFVTLHGGEIRHEDLYPGTRFLVLLPTTPVETTT